MKTDKFQKSLPRLPIPKLHDTLRRYLDSQRALLPEDSPEYRYTEKMASEFEQGAGPALDRSLRSRDKSNKHTSYISDFWFDTYLKSRTPIVLNYNPFIMLKDEDRPMLNDQLIRATNLIVSSLRFRNAHQENCLDPDVYHLNASKSDTMQFRKLIKMVPDRMAWFVAYLHKAYPLDMSQYPNLFASTRLPLIGRDKLTSHPEARHIVVIRNKKFFSFDVYDENGHIVDPKLIYSNLKYICEHYTHDENDSSLGLLTTMERDKWAKVRAKMIENSKNEIALDKIDKALFVVCLDDNSPESVSDTVKHFLCGEAQNRWFDKCFQLIVTPKGQAAVNFEHSWGDGIAVLRYINEVRSDSMHKPSVSLETDFNLKEATVKPLEFHVDDELVHVVKKAKEELDKKVDKLEISVCQQKNLTKSDVKASKLSPDAILQLAIQLSYYRLTNGGVAPTYESCSTAAFRHGRTETIRSATCETREACRLIGDTVNFGAISNAMVEAVRKSSAKHGQLTKEAAMGQGWDRHLMALRYLAEMGVAAKNHEAAEKGTSAISLFICPFLNYH